MNDRSAVQASVIAADSGLMIHLDRKYYKPSSEARVLWILDALTDDPEISQFELGRRMRLSGAMVNQYLRNLQQQGLVSFNPVNGKSYRYTLTPEGDELRRQLFSDYSSETIRLYTSLKKLLLAKVEPLLGRGKRRIALFGASETCEVMLSALRETPFRVLLLVDNDPRKQGTFFHGFAVSPPDLLETVDCQAVVITSFGGQREIAEQIEPLARTKNLEIVKL